jgi:hypothetical protein
MREESGRLEGRLFSKEENSIFFHNYPTTVPTGYTTLQFLQVGTTIQSEFS